MCKVKRSEVVRYQVRIQTSLLFVVTSSDRSAPYLAILDNYHLPRKNASYRLVILHRHLWGGRFQMQHNERFYKEFTFNVL